MKKRIEYMLKNIEEMSSMIKDEETVETSFNVDKVVEELEKISNESNETNESIRESPISVSSVNMENKKLLVDYITFDISPEMINESMEKNNGRLMVKGVLQRADAKNQNGRVYPKPILEREIKKYSSSNIAQRRALGELGHPPNPTVNLDKVSHLITSLKFEGNDVIGRADQNSAGNRPRTRVIHHATVITRTDHQRRTRGKRQRNRNEKRNENPARD